MATQWVAHSESSKDKHKIFLNLVALTQPKSEPNLYLNLKSKRKNEIY